MITPYTSGVAMQQSNAISSVDRPAAAPSALRTEPEQRAPADQRIADAAAKRPAPVDEAQVSPLARQLAAEEEQPVDANQQQQRADEKRQPERQQAQQQQGQVVAQKRFEVVA